MKHRTGFGYDVHRLEKGLTLVLGGVEIPYEKGCVAHSDGDVLLHAICDAILGAAALRDIGYYFPDNNPDYKNISSLILLKQCSDLLHESGYAISNIDSTVCMQDPKLSDFIPAMCKEISSVLNINVDQVNVKATTSERMGFTGDGSGVSAYAVCNIYNLSL